MAKFNENEIACGSHKNHPHHGKVTSSGFGGSQWYKYEDGTVKTYLDLLYESKRTR